MGGIIKLSRRQRCFSTILVEDSYLFKMVELVFSFYLYTQTIQSN